MEKYDKDRDGRISYSEFMDEILPKSPVKWDKFDSLWSKRLILILIMHIGYWKGFMILKYFADWKL
jgi:hypothetical protein